MKPLVRPKTKAITDALSEAEARTFLELVRIVQQRTDRETLEIRDEAGDVFGFLVLPVVRASPDEPPTDPEFLKELERRMQFPEPVLPVEVVLQFLDEYERAQEEGEQAE